MKILKKIFYRTFFNKLKRYKFEKKNIKKILILRHDKIGDMVVSSPLFREIKKRYPDTKIDVTVSKINKILLENSPHINNAILWDNKSMDIVKKIRNERYDIIFTPFHVFSFPYLLKLKLMRAKFLISFNVEKYGISFKSLKMFDFVFECDNEKHILDSYFNAFSMLELGQINDKYEIYGVEKYTETTGKFFRELEKPYKGYICFNYQGSSQKRKIDIEGSSEICRKIAEKYPDYAVIVIFVPGNEEEAKEIVKKAKKINVILSCKTPSIMDLAALIRECELIISPDTSVIHIASVYNKKILGFYIKSANHKWFYPKSKHYKIVLSTKQELYGIDVDETMKAVDELMAEV